MVEATSESPSIFTTTSLTSLAGVLTIYIIAHLGSNTLLPKHAKWTERATFIWMTFDALIHCIYEGSFLYLSTFGRQVVTSNGPFAEMWMEYAKADGRWGIADPTVVSLEILTVLGAAPMALYIIYLLVKDDPSRHYWIVVISTAELYGGFMTFAPTWLEGSPHLDTSNWLFLWVYLVFMNIIWVVVPLGLLYDSYNAIASSLRLAKTKSKDTKKTM